MSDETFIVPKRDLADIIQTRDGNEMIEFLENPLPVIAEVVIGMMEAGPKGLAVSGARLVQGALEGVMYQQLAKEIKEFRAKGKIGDFSQDKTGKGFQSWVELLRVIDEETPDEEKLNALKAMFFAANRLNQPDAEAIVAYQLFQIAKRLRSIDLLVLKTIYELNKRNTFSSNQGEKQTVEGWADTVVTGMAGGLRSLVLYADRNLMDHSLITPRDVNNVGFVSSWRGRLTDLGIRFCEDLEHYERNRPLKIW